MKIYKHNTGFTLIELMVAITIFVIATTITAFLVKNYEPDIRLYAASRELKSKLEKARSLTLTSQTSHGILFDINNNQYQLVDLSGPTVIETIEIDNLIDINSITSFTNNTVSFNAAGAASQNGEIVLINTSEITKTVEIKPSGYILVQ